MTPTEKKYAKRLGKLYWHNRSDYIYSSDGMPSKPIIRRYLVMIIGVRRRYSDAGNYMYYCQPLCDEKYVHCYLNKDGHFRRTCIDWERNEKRREFVEYKNGDSLEYIVDDEPEVG